MGTIVVRYSQCSSIYLEFIEWKELVELLDDGLSG
jgi:hypothetical protein